MLGPLPRLHRLLLFLTTLTVGIASGAWIAGFTPVPVAASAGAVLGALAGLALAVALVHDFSDRARPRRVVRGP